MTTLDQYDNIFILYDAINDRKVAVKELYEELENMLDINGNVYEVVNKALIEVSLCKLLKEKYDEGNESIVQIYDVKSKDKFHYVHMEYGIPLKWLWDNDIHVDEQRLMNDLDIQHKFLIENNIRHNDIHEGNIIFCKDRYFKLIDFGQSQISETKLEKPETILGLTMGLKKNKENTIPFDEQYWTDKIDDLSYICYVDTENKKEHFS
jgi:serine/threonine protein kinase